MFGQCRETENFVTEAMAFLSLTINWLLQICSAVMVFFFIFFLAPFLSFKLFILIAILVLTGVENELVSLVTKSVKHPHKVRMC